MTKAVEPGVSEETLAEVIERHANQLGSNGYDAIAHELAIVGHLVREQSATIEADRGVQVNLAKKNAELTRLVEYAREDACNALERAEAAEARVSDLQKKLFDLKRANDRLHATVIAHEAGRKPSVVLGNPRASVSFGAPGSYVPTPPVKGVK